MEILQNLGPIGARGVPASLAAAFGEGGCDHCLRD